MKELLQSHSFLTHLLGLFGLVGANVVVPNSPAVSIAVAAITGISQAAHAYSKVRTQPNVSGIDVGIRLPPPSLTNAAGTAPLADHVDGPSA